MFVVWIYSVIVLRQFSHFFRIIQLTNLVTLRNQTRTPGSGTFST